MASDLLTSAANIALADDLLRGAEQIAVFMFGDEKKRRHVYHLASEVPPEQRLPCFRLGEQLCARKSTLLAWISELEKVSRNCAPIAPAAMTSARAG